MKANAWLGEALDDFLTSVAQQLVDWIAVRGKFEMADPGMIFYDFSGGVQLWVSLMKGNVAWGCQTIQGEYEISGKYSKVLNVNTKARDVAQDIYEDVKKAYDKVRKGLTDVNNKKGVTLVIKDEKGFRAQIANALIANNSSRYDASDVVAIAAQIRNILAKREITSTSSWDDYEYVFTQVFNDRGFGDIDYILSDIDFDKYFVPETPTGIPLTV